MIRMLCGVLTPDEGKGSILGHDIVMEQDKIRAQMGYMSQKFSLYPDLTVYENLSFYAGMYSLKGNEKKERIEAMLDMADLSKRKRELAGNLSGGWRQRLALGCAILHRPKVLFLDEPTGGVDPMGEPPNSLAALMPTNKFRPQKAALPAIPKICIIGSAANKGFNFIQIFNSPVIKPQAIKAGIIGIKILDIFFSINFPGVAFFCRIVS